MPAVSTAIGTAAVAAIQGLGLVASGSVFRRKTASLPPGTDPPAVVVTVGEEGDTEHLTAELNLVRYPVQVTIVTAGGKKLADDDTLRQWRESIRVRLDDQEETAFSSVPSRNRVNSGGKALFDPAALAADLNYSVLTFEFESIESKG